MFPKNTSASYRRGLGRVSARFRVSLNKLLVFVAAMRFVLFRKTILRPDEN